MVIIEGMCNCKHNGIGNKRDNNPIGKLISVFRYPYHCNETKTSKLFFEEFNF